jgi:hypothetical protein
MSASFPGAVKSFTTKADNVDDVSASHVNDLQLEVAAIETALGALLVNTTECAVGSYSGSGSARDISITWPGGGSKTPKVVLIINDGGSDDNWIKTSTMAANEARPFSVNAAFSTGVFTSFAANKFSLAAGGGGGNITGQDYHYIAIG